MNTDNTGRKPEESSSDSSDVVQLAQRAATGDDLAFANLFGRYRDHLRRYVDLRLHANLRRRFDASDVVQETQIEAHRRLGDFLERRPMPMRIWLRSMARERMLNLQEKHLHRQKRSVRREVGLPDRSSVMLAHQLVTGGLSPSKEMIKQEDRKAVASAINQLKETDREVLLMRFIEGLSYQEIGCTLSINESAAAKRCGRALERLYEVIQI
jgi:RNA polymerase sigma-70 factor (ECF subfamily)